MQSELELEKPRDRIWGVWSTIGLGLLIVIATQVVQILVILVYSIKEFTSNSDFDPFQYFQDIASDGLLISISIIASSIVGLGLIAIFIKRRKGKTTKEYLGLNPIPGKQIFIMVSICIGFFILAQLFALFIGHSDDSDIFAEVYKSKAWLPLLVIAMAAFAPAFEESLFRGFLFVGLRQSPIGNTGAIALTALLWTLLHIQYGTLGLSLVFTLGIVLGIVRWKTGSLWGPIIIHSLWNLVTVVGAALYVD